jgi:N-acetylglucosaminyl-diphospho-decaprenol L-rhamnosyltransferase
MRPAASPELSVVVVTWNAEAVIGDCLASVFEQGGDDTEVIVVDNCSADGTIERVRRGFPSAAVVRTEANSGFASAANLGIGRARGERVLLLNPDARLLPGALEQLAAALDADPGAGAAGPSVVLSNGALHPYSARRFPSPWYALAREIGLGELLSSTGRGEAIAASLGPEPVAVPCLSGSALIITRNALEALGPLDESLPMYLEDLDLCARMGLAGLRMLYVPGAAVVHDGGHSSSRSWRRDLLLAMEDGQAPWMYQRRYRGVAAAPAYALAIAAGSALRLVLIAPLFGVARLLGRPARRFETAVHRAGVMLRWAAGSKSRFLARARSAFAGADSPAGGGGP